MYPRSALSALLPRALAICVVGVLSATMAHADVVFDWVTVGNPGNAADDATGYGAVESVYRISAHEVTNAQYAEFLNNVDADGTNDKDLYSVAMGTARAGINFNAGNAAGNKYTLKPDWEDKPVNYVSYANALRFVNWLHNGQGNGDTESGVYDLSSGYPDARASDADYFLPTEDQWYKAAYHQPATDGGDADDYWDYATASNTDPTVATATTDGDIANPGTNVANYDSGAMWAGNDNVTTVGSAGPDSASYYGTYDQAGNVREMFEALDLDELEPEVPNRGGAYNVGNPVVLTAAIRQTRDINDREHYLGFRVASPDIPEPATLGLLMLGGVMTLGRARRCRRTGASPAIQVRLHTQG